ncbi:MAG: YtxH domain-containing protein [Gemmatimonadaceae bacterium]
MSFGGTVTRGRRGTGSAGSRAEGGRRPLPPTAGRGGPGADPSDGEIDWERIAVFGTGIALGAALGAGIALLLAPYSGEEARAAILRRGARLAHQGRDAWDELRDELQWAARRGKRRFGRRVQRARWAAEDFIDDRRRPARWRSKGRPTPKQEEAREVVEIDERNVQEIVDSMC